MPDLNSYTNISTYIQTIYEDAMRVARENIFMPALVLGFDDRTGMAARTSSTWGTATFNNIGDTDDLTSQAFTPTVDSTITPAEKGAQFFLPDARVESDPFSVRTEAAFELGSSLATLIQQDLLNQFSSLTGGTIGAAGTVITWGHVFAARTRLVVRKAPKPYSLVLHEYQWHQLAKTASVAGATVVNAPQFQDNIMRQWYVGTIAGDTAIYTTADMTVDSSDDATGAIFSRLAMALDTRRAPRLEPERDASRRGWELNMTTIYARGVWRPIYGVKLIHDASAPSS